ncbi:MAG: hypothetical protein PWP47_1217 [Synergistaceae bacterium]|jgi:hypothetical protein|nr:hypothetical protein [Synergistaceae bacterium]
MDIGSLTLKNRIVRSALSGVGINAIEISGGIGGAPCQKTGIR